jgi:dTDP-4-amino-4,6-dideoxygalactose transaminase
VTGVPFTDVAAMSQEVWPAIKPDFLDCVLGGNYVGGAAVARFEDSWASYCGVSHCVGVANGTDALELTLTALGIGSGDEVVVPANTFIATAAAVLRAGAVPRFADVSDDTLLLTPGTLGAAITPRTAAVIVVHLYGQMPDMDALQSVADAHGLLVIEDAAQAHGAQWRGRRAGSIGAAACFSFYPGKNLGAFGDAGAVLTRQSETADRVRALANHGRAGGSAHDEHDFAGRNSRLDALQAIALSGKLAMLEHWTERRIALARHYADRLGPAGVRMVGTAAAARHVYHLLVVRVPGRQRVRAQLRGSGIETGVHYPVPCHLQPPLRRYAREWLPIAEQAAGEVLSLPLYPHMTSRQVDAVCAATEDALFACVGSGAP